MESFQNHKISKDFDMFGRNKGKQPVRNESHEKFSLIEGTGTVEPKAVHKNLGLGLGIKVKSYSVTFKVGFKTNPGQSLIVVGNIPQLGKWKSYSAKMKWTEGHIWVLKDILISEPVFQYKYLVANNGQPERWE